MADLRFININKVYDNNVQAVFDFNLEIKDKEFIVFVGPSGCGKSTTLRMVAGLEEITSGELYIDNKLVNEVLPKDRDIAMVFQNYALYPHMTVYENMAFGLKLRKYPKEEIDKRVKEAAEILGLTDYLKRKPKALSGGQRQRVALGRAIVRSPKVFLMDEPLSNLDAKLRVQMRSELTKIHQAVGATTIYVTHDQTEAMTMADRVVVMKDGYIQQIGTPKEIYNNPSNIFVATFIGSPAMNILNGKFDNGNLILSSGEVIKLDKEMVTKQQKFYEDKLATLKADLEECENDLADINKDLHPEDGKLAKKDETKFTNELQEFTAKKEQIEKEIEEAEHVLKGEAHEVKVGIRPEDIYLMKDLKNDSPLEIPCDITELLGRELIIYGNVGQDRIIIKTNSVNEIHQGQKEKYCFDLSKLVLFDKGNGKRII